MFRNAGKIIKVLAEVAFWLGSGLLAITQGFACLVTLVTIIAASPSNEYAIIAIACPLLWLLLWLCCLIVYSYGEMVNQIAEVRNTLQQPIPVYIKEAAEESTPETQQANIDSNMSSSICQLPTPELQRLLHEEQYMLSETAITLIKDTLNQRTGETKDTAAAQKK